MVSEKSLHTARVVSSIAATVISLACGSNYVYSAWGPQFAEKLKLSATESNLIGAAGNFGMYVMGIPVGIFVDNKGPRPAVIVGSFMLALGYFPLRQAYEAGEGSVLAMCFHSFCTGFGGCSAFAAAIKTSALNWPHHRGTATAFPLAAFGLSAFFFSIFAQSFLKGNTGDFLLLLAVGTFCMTFIPFFVLRVVPHSSYSSVSTNDGLSRVDSNPLMRTKSEERRYQRTLGPEPGTSDFHYGRNASSNVPSDSDAGACCSTPEPVVEAEVSETSSLVSRSSNSSVQEDLERNNAHTDRSHRVDIRGLKMLVHSRFWFLFTLMGLLAGIGLMTINNIGNSVNALWHHYDDSVTDTFIQGRQAMHVSILSVASFVGRLLSGVGSDFLVKHLHASRTWCLTIAAVIFTIAQLFAVSITDPHFLMLVSSLSGLGYGFLFGVFPSIVAEGFGVHGLSTNWGCMTIAPIISGNIFNLFYGIVYDAHSIVNPDGERECNLGLGCYRPAYFVTLVACIAAVVVSLVSIWHQQREDEETKGKDISREA